MRHSVQIFGYALITRTDHVTEEAGRRQDQRRSEVMSGFILRFESKRGTCGSFQAIV